MSGILRYLLAFVVLPSALFFLLKQQFFIIRGLVDLDYLVAGAVLPWLGPVVSGIGIALALLFDLLLAAAPAFHFRGGGFLEAVEYVFDIELWFVLSVTVAVVSVTGAYLWVTLRIVGPHRYSRAGGLALLLAIPALIVVDGVTTGNALMRSDSALIEVNVATSSAFETARSGYGWLNYRSDPNPLPIAAGSDFIRGRMKEGAPLPSNLMLVVSESMGLFREERANEITFGLLDNRELMDRYEIVRGSVPFFYSTVPGELRELCGVKMATTLPLREELPFDSCLPEQLAQRGYRTVAAHGFSGNFFNRQRWYPWMGFDSILFGSDIDARLSSPERCGVAFKGVCDDDVMDVLLADLKRQTSSLNFVYWLTLNAHTPFPVPRERYGRANCAASHATAAHEELCRLVGIYRVVVAGVVAAALDESLPETAFLIVGDHAPPLVRSELRELFDNQRVPYVILWPRKLGQLQVGDSALEQAVSVP